MDLSTNAGIIEEAIRFHTSNTELLNTMTTKHNKQEQDDNKNKTKTESSNVDRDGTTINSNTTNGVF